jgi:hypothetical protein
MKTRHGKRLGEITVGLAVMFGMLIVCATNALAAPMAEQYLIDGKLAEGEKALTDHLAKTPGDAEARMGLGVIQFFRAYETLGADLYQHGLRTERAFRNQPPEIRELLPQNPNPKPLDYAHVRKMLETWVADLSKCADTLAKVDDDDVKLPLHVGRIKIDLFGIGKPVSARILFGQINAPIPPEMVDSFVIHFDRGDVSWLEGYCHFMAALGEVLLAVDGQEIFDCTAHLFFEKVDSPYEFLQVGERKIDDVTQFDRPAISDVIAFFHLFTRFEVKHPSHLQSSHRHLLAMVTKAREMWKQYGAETDDDQEWIPNAKQTGVLQVKVTQDMIDAWLKTLDNAEAVLKGEKLIPFWRAEITDRGVNLKRAFMESKTLDIVLWVQGPGAAPFLEKGTITELAEERTLNRLSTIFGGSNFFGFAFWFN